MVVEPPSESVNYDNKSVFFDSVHIKPLRREATSEPMIQVGGGKDNEHQISIHDQKAKITSDQALPIYETPQMRANGRRLGFNKIGFIYEP
jgi:hypothetical protein